jgi:hypothetical protein
MNDDMLRKFAVDSVKKNLPNITPIEAMGAAKREFDRLKDKHTRQLEAYRDAMRQGSAQGVPEGMPKPAEEPNWIDKAGDVFNSVLYPLNVGARVLSNAPGAARDVLQASPRVVEEKAAAITEPSVTFDLPFSELDKKDFWEGVGFGNPLTMLKTYNDARKETNDPELAAREEEMANQPLTTTWRPSDTLPTPVRQLYHTINEVAGGNEPSVYGVPVISAAANLPNAFVLSATEKSNCLKQSCGWRCEKKQRKSLKSNSFNSL